MLRPMNGADEELIAKYQSLLDKVTNEKPDNTFFINMLKETIGDLRIKKDCRDASAKYQASLNNPVLPANVDTQPKEEAKKAKEEPVAKDRK